MGDLAGINIRGTDSIEAYDALLRGREFYYRQTPQHLAEAINSFKHAQALDPTCADAVASQAMAMWRLSYSTWGSLFGLPSWDKSRVEAEQYVALALSMDPQSSLAHTVKALTIYFKHKYFEEAVEWGKKGIVLSPNSADSHVG